MNTVLISKLVKQEHAIKGDLSLTSMNKYEILYLDVIGHGYFPITMPSVIQPTYSLFDCLDQYAICTGLLNWMREQFYTLTIYIYI